MMLKLFLILSFFVSSLRFAFVPTVVIDAADRVAPVSSRASGYLYGMAEAGVPSDLMADSLSVSSVSQKVTDGLQHPTGDIDHVAGALGNADYLVVYLQDCFSTWYYENDRIVEERRAGTYDPQAFLENDYFPQVKASLEKLAAASYADRVVCCLYNECDNGVWFGETRREGDNVWGDFSESGRDTFFDAWRQTYALVRSFAPELKIGGPGYYEYSAAKERDFLTYCAENGCVPDVMIWHELGELSSYDWEDHVNEYRAMEAELGIGPLPVIVTEYGTMAECGNPADMLEYVCAIERSGVYGDIAFWRLADNFNDNAADDNMPNACWWLYRWYAGMEGDRLGQEKCDLFHGDFEKAVKAGRPMKFRDFDALAALNGAGDRLEILCGDCDHSGQLVVKRLDKTALGKNVRVRVEEVVYQGLTGEVTRPLTLRDENVCAAGGTLRIPLKDMTEGSVYHVILTPASDSHDPVDVRPVRYEAEEGELLGDAYTYDSAYATTGQQSGMVGGMEKEGDGVKLTVAAPKAGDYTLSIIYGKHNDGSGPAGRVNGTAQLLVNGDPMTLTLPNTIKSEYTDCLTRTVTLKKGDNELTFLHEDGTFVLDSVLLTPVSAGQTDAGKLAVMPYRADSGAAFLTVAPADGCYPVFCDIAALTVDGAKAASFVSGDRVYLRRGLNLLTAAEETARCEISATSDPVGNVVPASEMTIAAPAAVTEGVLSGIASSGGSASFPFAAPVAGDYRVTLCYSNNQEGGYHAYNVDLIEAYFTVTVNGETRQVMCRNTYSDETFSTVTFNVTLPEGESVFTLSNDGSIRFDGRETAAPRLRWAAISPVVTPSVSGR